MSKHWTPNKKIVDLQPSAPQSRIRRDPIASAQATAAAKDAWWESREWEIRMAVAGIIFFALAICAAVIDVGELLSQ